ncbi:hypothetical protein FNV43_RR08640 [Rhamnella rubrinervis]|uniref:Uncharacterized protein n=1 Tax=Rhamnella rubrinervis TaxID=2594499 RepID=A0A8K0H9A2_9ROSA|nr:hypothetical protein FNV43_RR08640 [Rhamnella rubrinervis]
MAGNVFGNPVTDDIVRLIYPDVKEITPKLRSQVAFRYINADGRDVNCKNFVHNLKQRYGSGISSLCMIFNATGRSLTYVGIHDWHGHIYESPCPSLIQNGQWGAFLHTRPTASLEGSEGAVVYRGKNNAGVACDWMLAWSIPRFGRNSVSTTYLVVVRLNVAHVMEQNVGQLTRTGIAFTEIREAHHYETDYWGYIKGLLESKPTSYNETWSGCHSAVTIGGGTSPEFVGVMSLDGVLSQLSYAVFMSLAANSAVEDSAIEDSATEDKE